MKKILFGLFIFICLAIVGLLALPSFIDWNTRREWVERQLTTLLDRQVEIRGDLDFALLPTPILSAEQVRLADGAGGTLAEIDVVDLRMALLPLVRGRFDLEQVDLVNPVIALGEGGGALNVATVLDDPSTAQRVRLDRMTIENGTVSWRDPVTGQLHDVDQIYAQVTAESLAGPFSAAGAVRWAGQPVSVELNAGRLSRAGAWPMTIVLGLDGSGLEGRYSGLVGVDGQLQGDLRLSGDDLVETALSLPGGIDLPADWDQPFTVSAQLVGRDGALQLNGLDFVVGETRASGSMSVDMEAAPAIDLDVNVNRLDLARWASDGRSRWQDLMAGSQLPLPDGLRLTVDARIGALDLGDTPVRQVRLNATLGDGALSVSRLTAQLPGGTDLRAVGTIGPGEDSPSRADFAVEMASGDLRRLLTWAGIDVEAIPSTRLRAFNGRAGIAGTMDNLQISGLDMVVDATHLTGGLAYRGQGRPGLGLRLAVDELNLDAYTNTPIGSARQAMTDTIEAMAALWPALVGVDSNLDIEVGRLTAAETSFDGIRLDGTLNRGSLDLRDLSVASLDGASATLSGRIGQVWPLDDFDLTLVVSADAPRQVLDTFSIDPGWPIERLGGGQGQVRLAGGFDRIDVEVQLVQDQGDIVLGGSIADPLGRPIYDLATRITHQDLLQTIRFAWPDYSPRGDLGALDFYTTIEGTDRSLVLDDVIGRFGDVTVGGTIQLALGDDRPSFDAALGIDQIAIEPFLPTPGTSYIAPGDPRWSSAPVDLPDVSWINGHALLTANTIQGAGLQFDAPALDLSLTDGVVTLSQASAGLFGGQIGVSGHVALNNPVELGIDIALADANLSDLLRDVLQIDGAAGTLDLALNATGTGSSPAALIDGLQGDGLLAVRAGTVDRLDLSAVSDILSDLEGPLEFLEVVRGPLIEGTTEFAAFNAPLVLDDGVLTSDAMRWRADAGLGEGTAQLDLASLIFNAMLDITLFNHPEAPPFAVGFSGPLDRLERSLETDALRSWVAQQAAEALTDRLREPGDPVEN